jgi:cytochrome c553
MRGLRRDHRSRGARSDIETPAAPSARTRTHPMTRTRIHNGSRRDARARAARALALAAAFGAAGPALAQAAAPAGDAQAGRAKASTCVGCHEIPGYKASFPHVYEVPRIVGQSAKYIESALQAYRKGERSHPTMRAIAGSLTDQDIADLAALYGTK